MIPISIARKEYNASFFHIMVQGVNKEYIFDNRIYLSVYENIIKRKLRKYNINIIAYCIMSNHAHILINIDKIKEMSKYMHDVNTEYANYYNKSESRVGHVFRARFRSEPINNIRYLAKCINYIHMNPVKAKIVDTCEKYKYSSYKYYIKEKGYINFKIIKDIIGNDYIDELKKYQNNINLFLDIDKNKKINSYICDFLEQENLQLYQIFEDIDNFKNILIFLHEKGNITYTELCKKFNTRRERLSNLLKEYNANVNNV